MGEEEECYILNCVPYNSYVASLTSFKQVNLVEYKVIADVIS